MKIPEIPSGQQNITWVLELLRMLQKQSVTVEKQSKTIQKQAKTIQELKKRLQDFEDERRQEKKNPRRLKYREGNKDPSGNRKKSKSKNSSKRKSSSKEKEKIKVNPEDVPEGSRCKGYTNYSVQELTIDAKEIVYKLEVWKAPDGSIIRAALLEEIKGNHFGPDLRALIHSMYANGMTQPALFDFIRNTGIEIWEGQMGV